MSNNITKRAILVIPACVVALLTTGCVSFRGNQVAKHTPLEKATAPVAQTAQLDIRLNINGKPFPAGKGLQKAVKVHTRYAEEALKESGLFRQIQTAQPGATCPSGDFVLKYDIDNRGNMGAAMASGFICGFTLTAIPGFATDRYVVEAEAIDSEGKSRWKGHYEDKMTTVIWAGFFPCLLVPPCYPMKALEAQMKNIHRHALEDMQKANIFAVPTKAFTVRTQ
jgi:hypothetical protein